MFPFEFFSELNDQLISYSMLNSAFFLGMHIKMDELKKRELFEKDRIKAQTIGLNENNILSVEPLGELLLLETCCTLQEKEAILKGGLQRSQVPLSILAVQLYDSSHLAVFASDVTDESIERIPEVLWDDPNLLIAIVTLGEEGANLSILKAPPSVEQLLEQILHENTDLEMQKDNE